MDTTTLALDVDAEHARRDPEHDPGNALGLDIGLRRRRWQGAVRFRDGTC